MTSWIGMLKLPVVIFGIARIPFWIKASKVARWEITEKGKLLGKLLHIFGNLKRNWWVVPTPFCYNNFFKKTLGLKTKMKLNFLRIFYNPSPKCPIFKSFLYALALYPAIYQNLILVWNQFLMHIFCIFFHKYFSYIMLHHWPVSISNLFYFSRS